MAQSRDYDELLHYWQAWHEAVGPPLKNKYMRYTQLANQASRLNGKCYPQKCITFFLFFFLETKNVMSTEKITKNNIPFLK